MEDKNMKKQKSFLAIFSLLLLCASIIIGPLVQALPGDYVWQNKAMNGDTKSWTSIASSADGTKLAATEGGGFIYTSTDSGATWAERTSAGSRNWESITSSADGTKLAVIGLDWTSNGSIYTSQDSGATWTEQTAAGSRSWRSITSSADGTKLAVVNNGGSIYTSNDSGATWTERTSAGSHYWYSITSSADGTKLAAGAFGGSIYTSQDSGATWTERTAAGSREWYSITSSADGTKLAAVNNGGSSYTSQDSGATWTEQTVAGSRNWSSITSSADGTKLAAARTDGYGNGSIYTSADSGATWTEHTFAGASYWQSITSSADGTKLAATAGLFYGSGSIVYTSTDSGATWTERTPAGSYDWRSITSSADGTKLAAVAARSGSIYTSTDSGATWTEQTAAGSREWRSVTSSADGTKLAATSMTYNSSTGKYFGSIYTSQDSGVTWTEQTAAGSRSWTSAAFSADGSHLAAAAYSGNIWLGTLDTSPITNTFNVSTTTPAANVQPAVANAVLSVTSSTCYTIKPGTTTLTPNGLTAPEKNVTLLGGLSFSLGCATPGGTAPLTVSLGTKYPDTSLLRVYKKDPSSAALVDITSQVAITNNQNTTISYTLMDGGAFDEDKTVNGTIVDPIYIGLATTPAAPSNLAVTGMGMWSLLVTGASLLLVGVISILARRWVRVCRS